MTHHTNLNITNRIERTGTGKIILIDSTGMKTKSRAWLDSLPIEIGDTFMDGEIKYQVRGIEYRRGHTIGKDLGLVVREVKK